MGKIRHINLLVNFHGETVSLSHWWETILSFLSSNKKSVAKLVLRRRDTHYGGSIFSTLKSTFSCVRNLVNGKVNLTASSLFWIQSLLSNVHLIERNSVPPWTLTSSAAKINQSIAHKKHYNRSIVLLLSNDIPHASR